MNFVHLHTHTEYSLLDGANKIADYVARVKELGMNSAAITDHGVMYGVIDFYRAARAAGIKPIIGCEVYVAPGSRFDREVTGGDDRYYHLVLLAENNTGYANLIKIVSAGFVEGYYYRPRVDKEVLEKYHEGIIALSACLAGEIPRYLMRGLYEEAKKIALQYRDLFGEGNFFLELQDHGIPDQQIVNQQLLRMSAETGIPLAATNDVHYTYDSDVDLHDILLCIQTGKKLEDEDRMRYEGGQYYVKSPQEMEALFPYAREALENTQKIADRCSVEIEFGVTKLPRFAVPEGYTAWEYLNKLCHEGLCERYEPQRAEELKERLDYELGVIQKMGYVDYFLIVWDFIRYARDQGIIVGPGRGSAAGSLVSYTLGITKLDPIKYSLLFERFLNPERVSMPDIDIDFCFERRQEVIEYVLRKYGKDCVAQIVTFGTMAARAVVRDVGRVMNIPYSEVDAVAKMIPAKLPNNERVTIDKALRLNGELRQLYESDPKVTYLIDMSKRLEGMPRHASMHAAGVVICREAVEEYVPLARGTDGTIITQFTMTTLEELGLLKMDFLGLRTLTVIQNAVRMVEKDTGQVLDMDQVDFGDPKVLASLGTGKNDGVFQLESGGMKKFMKELRPQGLEDLIAGISLYRPGPMDFIPQYIQGKEHPESITYDCPQLKPILQATYGCIVYQEQVMQIVQNLAGFTLGRSDLLRRAMSKKKLAVMEKERKAFVYGDEKGGVPGCIKNGVPEETANKIYDEMIDFAHYAFNKSHAAAYAVVTYQTAWLKYYFPLEYMASLMTSVIDNAGKVAGYHMVCHQMGIGILPPDINRGESGFSVENGRIRYGLSALKSVGKPVIEALVAERRAGGPFTSLKNLVERMPTKDINKRTLESFIKSGALDCFGATRKQLMVSYTQVLDAVGREKKTAFTGQMSLFDLVGEEERLSYEPSMPDVGEYGKEELLAYEKEVLGVYVSGHPLEEYEELWRRHISNVTTDFQLDDETETALIPDGSRATVGGMITARTIKYTKNNKTMAFLTLEDLVGTVEVVVFPRDYEKYRALLNPDEKVFITGRVSEEDKKASKLICESIESFRDIHREVWIQFADRKCYQEQEQDMYRILRESDGKDRVAIYIRSPKSVKKLSENWGVSADEALLGALTEKFGRENVKIV